MFTTKASPQHERPQPSKYFSAARSPTSLSPPALAPDPYRRALSSTPVRAPAFLPASSLISRSAIVDHEHKPTQESRRNAPQHATQSFAEPTSSSKRHAKKVSTVVSGKNGGVKKRVVKSEEFILDSDESDTQREVGIVRSHKLGAPPIEALGERSSYFLVGDTRRQDSVAVKTSAMNPALVRRRSWTPLTDTVQQGPIQGAPKHSPTSGIRFTDLVSAYQYEESGGAQCEMALPPAKKRKVAAPKAPKEPKAKEATTKQPKVPRVKAVKIPKPPRVKQPKKKMQTITAMATAPYLPHDLQNAQITIPEVLAASNTRIATPIATGPVGVTTTKRKATMSRSNSAAVKKSKKSAKPKAKPVPRGEVPRVLLPPTQAQGSLSNQTFIFGTSSQLHVDESPTTLNHIQLALAESELSPRSTHSYSPITRSRTKVPTAPHGTSLSVGQANRDLWCVSARDDVGGLLAIESQESRIDSVHEGAVCPGAEQAIVDCQSVDQFRHEQIKLQTINLPSLDEVDCEQVRPHEGDLIDGSIQHDSFVMISSDTVLEDELDALPLKQILARTTNVIRRNCNTSPPPSQLPWPSAQRQVLHPLDANLSIKPPRDSFKQVRTFASTQPPTTFVQPRRRGRPSKALQQGPTTTGIVQISSSPVTRVETAQTTSPSKILATLQSSPPSEWHNIDEISDSETPPTPSPPRKRPNASPAIECTLELSGQKEVIEKDVPVSAPNRPPKECEAQWATELAKLYPKITSTIRAVPRSNSLTNPTWHEKILLYDPIVIEDLTTWLNIRGLRVTVRRSRAKARKKGAVQEAELVEEELSHWMVQKWCEEHSICCLWKEGLRGGVRTRY
ncbi:hypothetical protein AMS68_003919 [Peltaster fructicola]|uniref:Structure-specific endonuclease subunit SLX4 n=1 Tax=Peltaster fructicola TaxID=286661 RepID=A0A6H0XUH2_9PEZI|nr:hypothetical protein AMS68_003919 [Peltaster fructicola]